MNYAPHSLGNFLANMEPKRLNITHAIHISIEKLLRSTQYAETLKEPLGNYAYFISSIVIRDMLQGHDSSFMGDLMRPAYVSCNREIGI